MQVLDAKQYGVSVWQYLVPGTLRAALLPCCRLPSGIKACCQAQRMAALEEIRHKFGLHERFTSAAGDPSSVGAQVGCHL